MKTINSFILLMLMSSSSLASNDAPTNQNDFVNMNAKLFDKRSMLYPVLVKEQSNGTETTKIKIPGWDIKIQEASKKVEEK